MEVKVKVGKPVPVPKKSSPKKAPKKAVKKAVKKANTKSPKKVTKAAAKSSKKKTALVDPPQRILPPPSPPIPAPGPGQPRESKAAKRRRLKKNAKKRQRAAAAAAANNSNASSSSSSSFSSPATSNSNVNYVPEDTRVDLPTANDDLLNHFQSIFQKFATPADSETATSNNSITNRAESDEDDMDMDDDEYQPAPGKLSNRRKKEQSRLTVAQLKQLVDHPDVVEDHDVTAPDSRLLVHLKSLKGTVPVPRHWSQKRKYLQGKAGHEKSPYELPESVQATGIDKVRAAIQEEEDDKSTKQRQRERTRPKMGKINVDYQELYDAFFVHMKRPPLSGHGDIYFESKEDELGSSLTGRSKFAPGILSGNLKEALSMSTSEGGPPPWLFNMQRYGPPPSYPRQKVAGLNAPIPAGAEFGYHPGGWGKPPVDENGRPLYGEDVFDQDKKDQDDKWNQFDRSQWGILQADVEEEEEDDEEEEAEAGESSSSSSSSSSSTNAVDYSTAAGQDEEEEDEDMDEDEDEDMDMGSGTFDVGKTMLVEKPKQLYTVLHQAKPGEGAAGDSNFIGSSQIYTGLGGASSSSSSSSASSSSASSSSSNGTNNDHTGKPAAVVGNNDDDDDDDDDSGFKF